jgi:hypothetical protein
MYVPVVPDTDDHLGAYHGVFRWFMRSRTRACLLGHLAALNLRVWCHCHHCGAHVWSMVLTKLVPPGVALRRSRLEYFVSSAAASTATAGLLAHLTSSEG